MHGSCLQWVERIVAEEGLAGHDVLEVGSGDVNGSVRPLFHGAIYIGLDARPGPGVDQVAEATAIPYRDGLWPVVVSTEMLEHVLRPWQVMAELARVCAPSGRVIVTARGYDERGCFPVHRYPIDAWRFSDVSMRILAEDVGLRVRRLDPDPWAPGWFLLATKG